MVAADVRRSERGSASLELIGTLPLLLLALLVAAQLALAGGALWSAAIAARAGARAALVGRSAASAARAALPSLLRDGSVVQDRDGVSVRVRVPTVVPALPVVTVSARSALEGNG